MIIIEKSYVNIRNILPSSPCCLHSKDKILPKTALVPFRSYILMVAGYIMPSNSHKYVLSKQVV